MKNCDKPEFVFCEKAPVFPVPGGRWQRDTKKVTGNVSKAEASVLDRGGHLREALACAGGKESISQFCPTVLSKDLPISLKLK